ncbi:MAG: cupin domain-containing protein [Caldilineaceae bacterium]|nr:cupin domain-containing protein [Caldilineaceae bacterium]
MTGSFFLSVLDYAKEREDKAFKHTFFESSRLLAGLNVLRPGQSQPLHDHAGQDKFYYVLEGTGLFTVGEQSQRCGPGTLVLAPAGIPHGVTNQDPARLCFLTVIAPWSQG